MNEPKIEVIEGRRTTIVERKPPLPQKLDSLIGGLTHVKYRADVTPQGARYSCELREHRFLRLREGRYIGPDAIVRDLRIEMCADCGAVCVRDISFDTAFGGESVPIGRRGPNRKDHILGWYSGARRNGREHR